MTPARLLRIITIVEACTWALLLLAMLVKYVVDPAAGALLVPFAGAAHATAFLAYLFVVLVLAANGRWSARAVLLGALASVPPFATLWFDRWAERRGLLDGGWLPDAPPAWRPWPVVERLRGLVPWTREHPVTLGLATVAALLFILTPALGRALGG